jgi:uncharacterized protein YdhG (YjbR/CyaY superfamily)
MQSKEVTFAGYLSELTARERAVIRVLDGTVRAAAPGAKSSMRFGMPTYDRADRFMAINSQKNYFAFYADPSVLRRFRGELKGLKCGRSCIRSRTLEDAPLPALSRIARESLR